MTCDGPEPCEFPSLDSCQKRFLWAYKEVDLALHPVAGLAEMFLQTLAFESLDLFLLSPSSSTVGL